MNLPYYFKLAIEKKASDLHLVEGSIPSLRIFGELTKLEEKEIPFGELKYAVFNSLDKATLERFKRKKDLDLSMEFFGYRFRINLHYQEGKMGLAARLVPNVIPTPKEIGFDETIYSFTHFRDGLILVTGPTGMGKSTTLAVMIDLINAERRSHILTIEDPIEFNFHDKQSIVEQRQIGRDTESFSSALKYALRQDPNVIMVGELRDLETIQAALTAAKTGHLVLATLHTSTAAETVERIIDFFPVDNQSQIAHQLASVLRAVIAQQLLPARNGGMAVAREIMTNNAAISNIIRAGKYEQLYNTMQNCSQEGMVTMNKAIDNLYHAGQISEEVAKNRKRDLETQIVYY